MYSFFYDVATPGAGCFSLYDKISYEYSTFLPQYHSYVYYSKSIVNVGDLWIEKYNCIFVAQCFSCFPHHCC